MRLGIGLGLTFPRFAGGGAPVVIERIVVEGDSLVAYTTPRSYALLWQDGVTGKTINNFGVGGSNTESMVARKSAVDAANPQVLYVAIGANELYPTTAQYLAALYAYTDPYRAGGTKIIIGTILPRSGGVADWDAKRAERNAALRADVGVKIDDVVDFDTTTMGANGANLDTTLYPDNLHPSATGFNILKRAFAPVMNHWVGIANEPLDFAFAPQAAATVSTAYDSPIYTVKGLYPGETRPYSVPSGVAVSKNGGAFVVNGFGTAVLNDTFRIRNPGSPNPATQTDVSLTIGSTTATYSVTTAGAGSRDWIPTDLGAKLKLWLRPESIAGADTTQMNTWPDSSGNALTVTGFGFGSKPTVKAAGLNGFKTVLFALAYNQPKFDLPTGYLTGRTSGAAFFVSKMAADPTTTGYGSPISQWGSSTDDDIYPFSNGIVYSGYGSTTRHLTVNPGPSLADWRFASFHATTNDWRYYLDGTALHTLTSNTFGNGTAPRIGTFTGDLAEVIDCTDVLTTAERQLVEGYLAWKYGLQANLPAGHPYLAGAPTI